MTSEAIKRNRQELATRLYDLAREALAADRIPDAVELLRASTAASPHFKTLELLGEHLMVRGEVAEGVLYLAAAVGLGRRQPRARFLLAQALGTEGEIDDALDLLEEALSLNPNYQRAVELRAQLRKMLLRD